MNEWKEVRLHFGLDTELKYQEAKGWELVSHALQGGEYSLIFRRPRRKAEAVAGMMELIKEKSK